MADNEEIRGVAKVGERLQAFPIIAELHDTPTRESPLEYVEEGRSGSLE